MSQPGDPSRPRTARARRRVVRGWRLVSQTGARVVPLNRLNPRVRAKVMLPSLFTLGNMICGFSSVLMAFQGRFRIAAVLIAVSIVLDIFDGAVARAVGAITPFGLQFDSLADLISFGIAPAVLVYTWALPSYPQWAWAGAMFWLACAAYRLARFNVTIDPLADKRYFIGLPSPGAAGVVIATVFAIDEPLEGAPAADRGRRRASCADGDLLPVPFLPGVHLHAAPAPHARPARGRRPRPRPRTRSDRYRHRLRLRPHRALRLAHRSAPSAMAGARRPCSATADAPALGHHAGRGWIRALTATGHRRGRVVVVRGRRRRARLDDVGDEAGGDIEGGVGGEAR